MSSTLVNALPVEVTHRDGSKSTVVLRDLSIRQLHQFSVFMGEENTPALVALAAGQPAEWVDTLSDDSYDALVRLAQERNFPRAIARAASDPIALARLAPLQRRFQQLGQLAQLSPPTSGANGSTASPTPAPSESAAETGSAAST
jgi:hypothetical protein